MKSIGVVLDRETSDLSIKVKRNAQGEIESGLELGDVSHQNQLILIYMHPGELKEYPTVGVGLDSLLLSSDALLYKHKIREQLEADGFSVSHLEIKQNQDNEVNIELNALY